MTLFPQGVLPMEEMMKVKMLGVKGASKEACQIISFD